MDRPAKRRRRLRAPLDTVRDVDDVVESIRNSKQIIVVVGAGISRSCGIPDFRSTSGIYSIVKDMDLGLPQPECLFDLFFFQDDPSAFYTFAHNLFPKQDIKPSPTHRFIKALENMRKLNRVYSQNIDGLEAVAGIKKVIQCHGTLQKMACLKCKQKTNSLDYLDEINKQAILYCRKPKCSGLLKPTITFFGETIHSKVHKFLDKDTPKADMLIVIGTSMQVAPVSKIPAMVHPDTPQVFINKTRIKSDAYDVNLYGDSDTICTYLLDKLNETHNSSTTIKQTAQRDFEFFTPTTHAGNGPTYEHQNQSP
mmetsp:Transcript_7261/g.11591  ORF Transcript_7261/g.11591 Transcript_7261/m.11591 type:complete len:310 (+) Transcript_7261:84-1013(+)